MINRRWPSGIINFSLDPMFIYMPDDSYVIAFAEADITGSALIIE